MRAPDIETDGTGQLLISFCNTQPKGFPLGRFDFTREQFAWVGSFGPEIEGATGLCACTSGFYVLLQSKRPMGRDSALGLLGSDLQIHRTVPLDSVRDAHSLIQHEGALLVASTGTNQIIRVCWDGQGLPKEEVFWSAVERTSEDNVHVNSILEYRGDVLVSLFGAKIDGAWDSSNRGEVRNLTTGQVLCDSLRHPHSLFSLEGGVCCLSSLDGRVVQANDSAGQTLWNLPGYVRGVVRDGRFLFVATSRFRQRSRKTGRSRLAPLAMSGCRLHRIDLLSGQIEMRDLSPFGQEIYDLAVLPRPLVRNFPPSREEALLRRITAFDDQHREMVAAYEENAGIRVLYDRELRRLINADQNYAAAAGWLERLLEGDPTNADWQYHYAFCLASLGSDYKKAIVHFERALAGGFSEFWVRYNLASAYLHVNQTEEAEANWNRARELQPEEAGLEQLRLRIESAKKQSADELVRLQTGTIHALLDAGEFEHALEVLGEWRPADTAGLAEREYLLGFSMHMLGREAEAALEHYNAALRLGFDEFWVLYNRGQLLRTVGKHDSALEDLRRACALRPDHTGAAEMLQLCTGRAE